MQIFHEKQLIEVFSELFCKTFTTPCYIIELKSLTTYSTSYFNEDYFTEIWLS